MRAAGTTSRGLAGLLIAALACALAGCGGHGRFTPKRTTTEGGGFAATMLVTPQPLAVSQDGHVYLVDTGASAVFLSSEIIEANRDALRPTRTRIDITDGSGRSREVRDAVRVETFSMGGARFDDFNALVLHGDALPGMAGGRVDAILGMSLFRRCAVTIDFPAAKFSVAPSASATNGANGALPLKLDHHGLPRVPIDLAGRRVWAVLDTGSDTDLSVPPALARDLPFDGPAASTFMATHMWTSRRVAHRRLAADVKVGPHVIRRPILDVTAGAEHVSIGAGLLRHFALTIDAPNERVTLRRALDEPIDTPALLHFGFVPGELDADRGWEVLDVIPGTEAQRIGLHVGDRLISLDGVPFTAMKDWSWQRPADAGKAVRLEFACGGQTLTRTLRPTVLVP